MKHLNGKDIRKSIVDEPQVTIHLLIKNCILLYQGIISRTTFLQYFCIIFTLPEIFYFFKILSLISAIRHNASILKVLLR